MKKIHRNKRKGAALVEYAFLIAGIALIAAASVATFGHKTNDMIAGVAGVIPGAHADDNNPIVSGRMIETKVGANNGVLADGTTKANGIALDIATIVANNNTVRLGNNLGVKGQGDDLGALVLEPNTK